MLAPSVDDNLYEKPGERSEEKKSILSLFFIFGLCRGWQKRVNYLEVTNTDFPVLMKTFFSIFQHKHFHICLFSLFNSISTFAGYFMPKNIFITF